MKCHIYYLLQISYYMVERMQYNIFSHSVQGKCEITFISGYTQVTTTVSQAEALISKMQQTPLRTGGPPSQ